MLLPQDVWLTSSALDFLASRQGLTLPATLRPEPIWRDENELAELSDAAHAELARQNLLDRGAPSIELVIALRALCAGERECFAYIGTEKKSWRAHTGVSGSDAVYAEYTEGSDQVVLRDAAPERVPHAIVDAIGECQPATERTITCAVSDLTAPTSGIAVERTVPREAKRMKTLHDPEQRLREAKLMVAVRDRNGRRHTNGRRAPVVLDVQPGARWITYLTGSPDAPYLNARGADRAMIVERIEQELSALAEQH